MVHGSCLCRDVGFELDAAGGWMGHSETDAPPSRRA